MKPKQKPFLQNLDLVTTILPLDALHCYAVFLCYFRKALQIFWHLSVFSLEMSLEAITC